MKAILVLDTPKTCKECPCQMMLVCVPADEDIDEYVNPSNTKPNWCPLRPMPQMYCTDGDDIEEDSYWMGWNECVDEITGETE